METHRAELEVAELKDFHWRLSGIRNESIGGTAQVERFGGKAEMDTKDTEEKKKTSEKIHGCSEGGRAEQWCARGGW